MEFSVLIAWVNHFLLIIGGFLIFMILLLFSSMNYTKNKGKQMEENDEKKLNTNE